MRRPTTSHPSPASHTLTLRDGREWAVAAPSGGWTPAAAHEAANAFSGGDRRQTAEAFRALVAATPGLSRAYAVERVRGFVRSQP